MLVYALTIFVSAFLLFLIQPIIAKQILPWFGGTAAVWTTCLVFFQFTLLTGYFYSHWLTHRLKAKQQVLVHLTLVAATLALLPIIPDVSWKPQGDENPGLRILLLLAATIGLPYFLLSTTSPLIQAWFARRYPGVSPYRLFALSNTASMLALLGYPFLLEPWISTRAQAVSWSVGFGLFALLIAAAAWVGLKYQPVAADVMADTEAPPAPGMADKFVWIALSALGSMLLLAISNHLTQNISSIPLLWVVPLALYLLTFILCFDAKDTESSWYQRNLFLPMLAVALIAMMAMLANADWHFMLYSQIGVFSFGLFIACMFCHGELVARRPHPQHLTRFYLMVSVGGAIGALLVGVVAPLVLPGYFELEISLALLALLAVWLLWRQVRWPVLAGSVVVSATTMGGAGVSIWQTQQDVLFMTRNFYGALRVKEYNPPAVEHRRRSLIHGGILHGDQYQDPLYRGAATTYYKAKSGIGRALLLKEKLAASPRRVGIIGLGAGTLAAYGNRGDVFRFYDINPAVVSIAQRYFSYLEDSAARIEIALGDARLNLAREASQNLDILAIDAFSSDSIPVHLITLEALQIYEKHMKPDGVIAFHVSNRFLNLKPVVKMLAERRGLSVAWVREVDENGTIGSDWVLLSKDQAFLLQPDIAEATQVITPKPNWRLWTDDFNNLLQVLH